MFTGPLHDYVEQYEDQTYLDHESDDEDHSHAGDDVCVILYDELMAEYRWIFVGTLPAFDRNHRDNYLFIYLINVV